MRKIENPKEYRENMRSVFVKLLEGNEKKATNLEIGIYNYTIKESEKNKIIKDWTNEYFVLIYNDRCRSIYTNLKRNPELITQVNNGTYTAKQLAFMTHQEFNPAKWEPLIQEKIKRDKIKYETQQDAMTDTFTCKKCKSKKCSYYQLQTRSSDEPMTVFVNCLDCGARWRG